MRVVVTGASIAGLSAAHWLDRLGHEVVLVERSTGPRQGGVAVDVRGPALDVARGMGVLAQIEQARVTGTDVFTFVDSNGRVDARLRVAEDFYDSPDDIEIARDGLCSILADAVPARVIRRFRVGVEDVIEHADSVEVRLGDGTVEHADLLVGADGMHSRVRRAVFGPDESYVRHLGLYVAIIKRCRAVADVTGTLVHNTADKMVMLRGDGRDCSAILGFRSAELAYDHRDLEAQKRLVLDAFAPDTQWRIPAVLAEVPSTEDFYFDAVAQVHMPRWSSRRTVLVGDAAYCASFFSGMGTSLAMIGAQSLADCLDAHPDDLPPALQEYEARMRPVVDSAQALAHDGAAILFPPSAAAIDQRNATLRAGGGGP